jgi:sugar lactone lactonase YvrE
VGYADGSGVKAQLDLPWGVAVDKEGTVGGVTVSTLAGSGTRGFADGRGAEAQFNLPWGVAVDKEGTVYVADYDNLCICKISPAGDVSTFDNSGNLERFFEPTYVAVDAAFNVYFTDCNDNYIRKISPSGEESTFAGSETYGNADGNGAEAQFGGLSGIAVDAADNVYVMDTDNHRICKISPSGDVSTLADGSGVEAQFYFPEGVAVDAVGNVYVADSDHNRICKISPAGDVSTLAGSETYGFADGSGAKAKFRHPVGVAVDAVGNVYVADNENHRIRKISPTGDVSTLAGSGRRGRRGGGFADGSGIEAQFNGPSDVAVDAAGNVYVADAGNHRIRKITQNGEKNGGVE